MGMLKPKNVETYFIIDYIELDKVRNIESELLEIVKELHNLSLDIYTYSKELEWYFQYQIKATNLLKFYTAKPKYRNKTPLLDKVDWFYIAYHYTKKFKDNPDIHFSSIMCSYNHDRFAKDNRILTSGTYIIHSSKYGSFDTITLAPPAKKFSWVK